MPLSTVLRLLVYQIPEDLAYGMPMAILLGTLIGLGKMTGHSETIAIRTGRVRLFQVALPVLLTGLLVRGCDPLFLTKMWCLWPTGSSTGRSGRR